MRGGPTMTIDDDIWLQAWKNHVALMEAIWKAERAKEPPDSPSRN